jgi:hypothetical protein
MKVDKREALENRFAYVRGKILSDSVEVELNLEGFICDYFFKKNSHRKNALFWYLLSPLDFNRKIQLFEKIPYLKKRKNHDKVVKSLKYIQSVRNRVAHDFLMVPKSEWNKLVIRDPKKLNDFILDENLLSKFDENVRYLMLTLLYRNRF